MLQIGIDGFIFSQTSELVRPVNERLLHSCAYSYRRCLEDLAFALVYSDKVLKYGSLRPPLDSNKYSVPDLLNAINEADACILGDFPVDKDIHGDQLIAERSHSEGIIRDLRLLEESVRSESDQARFKEWLARESDMYFGWDESVFEEKRDPAEYLYGTTVPYHMNRKIQDSIAEDVIKILDSALQNAPKNLPDRYSDGARREFVTRNMLTLVTIMRAYELSAFRNGFWRMPHVTRVIIGFRDLRKRIGRQLDLRRIIVRYTLHQALAETPSDSRESVIKNLCELRNEKYPKAIRELLSTADLCVLNADEAQEEAAGTLIAEINRSSIPVPEPDRDTFVIKRQSTLRELGAVKWATHEDELFRVFPELKTDYDNKYTFVSPSKPESDADVDRRFANMAIEEARKSVPEDDRPHPKVGAVVVRNGIVLSKAHRGESPKSHAEYIALEGKLPDDLVAGATVYTTLEPCTSRKHPKIPCAQRLVERKVARVVIGMLDPNPGIRGLGEQLLSEAGIETQLFPRDLRAQVEEMNREFIRAQKIKQPRSLPNGSPDNAITVAARALIDGRDEAHLNIVRGVRRAAEELLSPEGHRSCPIILKIREIFYTTEFDGVFVGGELQNPADMSYQVTDWGLSIPALNASLKPYLTPFGTGRYNGPSWWRMPLDLPGRKITTGSLFFSFSDDPSWRERISREEPLHAKISAHIFPAGLSEQLVEICKLNTLRNRNQSANPVAGLSERETKILSCAAQGDGSIFVRGSEQIADRFFVQAGPCSLPYESGAFPKADFEPWIEAVDTLIARGLIRLESKTRDSEIYVLAPLAREVIRST